MERNEDYSVWFIRDISVKMDRTPAHIAWMIKQGKLPKPMRSEHGKTVYFYWKDIKDYLN